MQPTVRTESVRMLSFLASSDTCTSRAKRYAVCVASAATLGHPYNSICFPRDAGWSEVAAEFCAMMVQLESCTSLPIARRSSTARKACYMLEFNKKGFPYGQVIIRPDLPLPRTRKPVADVPLTVAAMPRPAKPVKPYSPSVKQTLHALMMTDFMGEISRGKLEYASCAGKGRSCTKP